MTKVGYENVVNEKERDESKRIDGSKLVSFLAVRIVTVDELVDYRFALFSVGRVDDETSNEAGGGRSDQSNESSKGM